MIAHLLKTVLAVGIIFAIIEMKKVLCSSDFVGKLLT